MDGLRVRELLDLHRLLLTVLRKSSQSFGGFSESPEAVNDISMSSSDPGRCQGMKACDSGRATTRILGTFLVEFLRRRASSLICSVDSEAENRKKQKRKERKKKISVFLHMTQGQNESFYCIFGTVFFHFLSCLHSSRNLPSTIIFQKKKSKEQKHSRRRGGESGRLPQ